MSTSERSKAADITATWLGLASRLPALLRRHEKDALDFPGHPVFGSLLEFRKDRTRLLLDLARHGSFVRMRLGVVPLWVASAPELVQEVLVEQADAFVKSPGLGIFARPLLGDGLLTSEHDAHRRRRRMLAPHFKPGEVARYAGIMAEYAERARARWSDRAVIDAGAEMMRLTMAIVGKTLFDADVDFESADIGQALTHAMQFVIESASSVLPLPPTVPTPRNLRHRRTVERLDRTIYRIIAERRRASKPHDDLLQTLLAARDDESGGLTDREVRDEAMTLFLAGHETTANALTWTLYLLSKHPEARTRLEAEVRSVLGGRVPAYADLPSLPYALAVLKEAMRLYPPAYFVGRRAEREVTVGGRTLPPGTVLFLNIYGIHRSGKYFRDPERFEPERFLGAAERALPRHAFVPFGAGPRVCIGNHFALMEAHVVLATLARHVRLDVEPSYSPVPEPLITLRPRGPVSMRVSRIPS
jgi:cytochrome P450